MRRKSIVSVVLLVSALSIPATIALGQVVPADNQMPYQGHLELNGVPQSGQFDFIFELYDAQQGGELLWSDEFIGVQVSYGSFSVTLGRQGNEIDHQVWQNESVYLAIQVKDGGGAYLLLSGRQRILGVPYAARSATAKNYHVTGNLVVDGVLQAGTSTLDAATGALSVSSATVNGDLSASGGLTAASASIAGTLSAGSTTVNGNLNVTGEIQSNGNKGIIFGGWYCVRTLGSSAQGSPNPLTADYNCPAGFNETFMFATGGFRNCSAECNNLQCYICVPSNLKESTR